MNGGAATFKPPKGRWALQPTDPTTSDTRGPSTAASEARNVSRVSGTDPAASSDIGRIFTVFNIIEHRLVASYDVNWGKPFGSPARGAELRAGMR